MIPNQESNNQSFDFIYPDIQKNNNRTDEFVITSPNLVGLLAGLITIPVILGLGVSVIWILWTLVTYFSSWNVMM